MDGVIARVQDLAAVSADVFELMAAVPSLASIVRYGDVRGTDTTMVTAIIRGLLTRICVGLPAACASLNDDAAQIACKAISQVHSAVGLLQMIDMTAEWQKMLGKLATQSGLHGVVGGRCARFLLQAGVLSTEEVGKHFGMALSRATDPAHSAAWCEGFLQDSGILIVNDESLWQIVDSWVSSLHEEHFQQQLPILRRTFASFQAPERRALGERVGRADRPQIKPSRSAFDLQRAQRALPMLAQLLGLKDSDPGGTQ
jgi:hypothetical protein